MVTAARNRKKMLGCISGHESTISTSARTLSPTASPYQGRPGTAERRRRVSVCGAPSVSLDVCCVDSKRDRKGVIIVSPHQGAKDGPTQPYPTACRLGGHRARALPAAEGGGERALLPAGHRAVLLPPVPRGGGTLSFLVAPQGEEAQALFGAPQTGDRSRAGGRSGDLACGLYLAGSPASAPGFPVCGFRRGRVGTLGFLQRLRGQAAPPVRPQPYPHLLRAHPRKRGGHLPDRGTHQRGGFGRGSGEVSLGRPGLPE